MADGNHSDLVDHMACKPGEARQLRVFICHRWGNDRDLYGTVLTHLRWQFGAVQDLSIPEEGRETGPRGGALDDLDLTARIARRIYTSDVVLAPSRVATTRSEWVAFEVELAAVAFSIPVVFVDHEEDIQRRTSLIAQMEKIGARHAVVKARAGDILLGISNVVGEDPHRQIELEPKDRVVQYRGPDAGALKKLLREFPYERKTRFAR